MPLLKSGYISYQHDRHIYVNDVTWVGFELQTSRSGDKLATTTPSPSFNKNGVEELYNSTLDGMSFRPFLGLISRAQSKKDGTFAMNTKRQSMFKRCPCVKPECSNHKKWWARHNAKAYIRTPPKSAQQDWRQGAL